MDNSLFDICDLDENENKKTVFPCWTRENTCAKL